MAKNNCTIDRIQAIWNMIGGDDVVDQLIVGAAKLTVEIVHYLTHLTSVTLASTKGSVTIAAATDVFTGSLDPNFQNWGINASSKDTAAQIVGVHEMSKNATFAQLFSSRAGPRSLCLTQGQIVEFCRTHSDQLRQGIKTTTLFLFELDSELFVVSVYVSHGKLYVSVLRFDRCDVWLAHLRHRVVVKQQSA